MLNRLSELRRKLNKMHPGTDLVPISEKEAEILREQYPGIPEELITFLRIIGCGRIGNSKYMIHGPMDPDAIYDEADAKRLVGVVLVGDNFSGNVEAYDTRQDWLFGSIGSTCKFEPYEQCGNFIEFLEQWYTNEKPA